MKSKTFRVLFEFPEKWVDLETPTGVLGGTFRSEAWRALLEEFSKRVLDHYKDIKIEITPEEIKTRVIDILAQEQVDKINN